MENTCTQTLKSAVQSHLQVPSQCNALIGPCHQLGFAWEVNSILIPQTKPVLLKSLVHLNLPSPGTKPLLLLFSGSPIQGPVLRSWVHRNAGCSQSVGVITFLLCDLKKKKLLMGISSHFRIMDEDMVIQRDQVSCTRSHYQWDKLYLFLKGIFLSLS